MAIKLSSASLNVILIYFEYIFYGFSHVYILYTFSQVQCRFLISSSNLPLTFFLFSFYYWHYRCSLYREICHNRTERKTRTMKLTDHYLFSLIFNLYYTSKYFCFRLVVVACRMPLNVVPFGK